MLLDRRADGVRRRYATRSARSRAARRPRARASTPAARARRPAHRRRRRARRSPDRTAGPASVSRGSACGACQTSMLIGPSSAVASAIASRTVRLAAVRRQRDALAAERPELVGGAVRRELRLRVFRDRDDGDVRAGLRQRDRGLAARRDARRRARARCARRAACTSSAAPPSSRCGCRRSGSAAGARSAAAGTAGSPAPPARCSAAATRSSRSARRRLPELDAAHREAVALDLGSQPRRRLLVDVHLALERVVRELAARSAASSR